MGYEPKPIQAGDYVSDPRHLSWPFGGARIGRVDRIVNGEWRDFGEDRHIAVVEWPNGWSTVDVEHLIRVLPATPKQIAAKRGEE